MTKCTVCNKDVTRYLELGGNVICVDCFKCEDCGKFILLIILYNRSGIRW